VWIRLRSAPWWLRCGADTCLLAVVFLLIGPGVMPQDFARISSPPRLVFLGGFSLAAARLMVTASQRSSRCNIAAVRGLSRSERGALRTQAVVLAAAPGIATMRLPHGRRSSSWVAASCGLVVISWLLMIVGYASGDGTHQTVFKGLVTGLVSVGAWSWYVTHRVELLQSALEETPDATDAFEATQQGVASDYRWRPPVMWGTAIVLMMTAALAVRFSANDPPAECRTITDVMRFIGSHKDKVDPAFVSSHTARASLGDHQQWSQQLQRYAPAVSIPDIAPRVHNIANLSVQENVVVRDARNEPASSWRDPTQVQRRNAYASILATMIPDIQAHGISAEHEPLQSLSSSPQPRSRK